ncbi:MAG: hypothetical protein H7Y15_05450, partial [Pseudonocardia sp.]|nr:hypothetical protein [Pseudonocardia sp.]
ASGRVVLPVEFETRAGAVRFAELLAALPVDWRADVDTVRAAGAPYRLQVGAAAVQALDEDYALWTSGGAA